MAATAGTACICAAGEYCDSVKGCQLCSWVASPYQEILCPCEASRDTVIGCTTEVKEDSTLCRRRSKALEECARRGHTTDYSSPTVTSAGSTTATRLINVLSTNGSLVTSAILQTRTASLETTRAAERLSTSLPVSRQYMPGELVVILIASLFLLIMISVLLYHCLKNHRQMQRLHARRFCLRICDECEQQNENPVRQEDNLPLVPENQQHEDRV